MSLSGKLTVVAAVVVVSLYCLPGHTLATLCNDNTNYYNCPPVGSPDATTCCPYSGPTLSGPYCCYSSSSSSSPSSSFSSYNYDYSSISYSGVSLAGWKIGLIVAGGIILFIVGVGYAYYRRRRQMLCGAGQVTNVQTVTEGQGDVTIAGTVPGGVVPIATLAIPHPGPVSHPYSAQAHAATVVSAPAQAAAFATVVSAPEYTGPQAQAMPTTLGEAPPRRQVVQQYPTAPQYEGTDREQLIQFVAM